MSIKRLYLAFSTPHPFSSTTQARNRDAAAKSRQRRLDHIAQLEARVRDLEGEVAHLQNTLTCAGVSWVPYVGTEQHDEQHDEPHAS